MASVSVATWDSAGRLVEADPSFQALTAEAGRSAVRGAALVDVLGPRHGAILRAAFQRARDGGETRTVLRSFGPRLAHLSVHVRHEEGDTFTSAITPFEGRASNDDGSVFAEALGANVTEMIVVFDRELRVRAYNPTYAAGVHGMLGRDVELGDSILDVLAPSARDAWKARALRALAGEAAIYDLTAEMVVGATFTYEVSLSPIRREGGVHAVLMISRDVTAERERVRSATHDAELRRSILAAMRDMYVVVDDEGVVLDCRGVPDVPLRVSAEALVGKSFRTLPVTLLPIDRLDAAFEQARTTGESVQLDYDVEVAGAMRHRKAWLRRISPCELIFVVRDVTDERRAAERMAFTTRLASIGTLAASVAHELNNPLQYVRMNVELVLDRLASPHDDELRALLRDAIDGLERAGGIVGGLKTLSRPQSAERAQCDAGRAIAAAAKLAQPSLKQRATLEIDIVDTGTIDLGETQLVQVVLNLVLNARDAFGERPASQNHVRVRTEQKGAELVITVSDDGPGIPPDVLPQIFDAFFTTKPAGQGTGLGLAIASELARTAGGSIEVSSQLGVGATFSVRLPVHAPRSLHPPAAGATGRTPLRILLIDDEPMVLGSLRRSLGHHHTTGVSSVDEALELLRHDTFDVILSDVSMPERTGLDLWDALRAEHPECARRLILMTGGVLPEDPRARALADERRVLHKPFSARTLAHVIEAFASAHR